MFARIPTKNGFTLLEVLVSLILGALIVGGLLSVSLQYTQRIKAKAQVQPFLETAAEEILADPSKALSGNLAITKLNNAPDINIRTTPMEVQGPQAVGNRRLRLVHVVLESRGQVLEFSVLVQASII